MTHLYIIPQWFFGFDIGMELLFGLITLAVAFSAWRIYKISEEKSLKRFSIGFLLIALSYIIWAIINWLAFSKISSPSLELEKLALNLAIGIYAHIFLLTAGFVMLAYTTFKTEDKRIFYLILSLAFLVIASSFNKLATFRILSVFLLIFIAYYYFTEWRISKSKNLMCTFFAFALLILSNLDFAFSESYYQAYVIGHILELGAYLLILKNLIFPNKAK